MPKKRTPPLVVGCPRFEDTKAARMVDGSETLPCERCQRSCWAAPSSLQALRNEPAIVLCLACVEEVLATDKPAPADVARVEALLHDMWKKKLTPPRSRSPSPAK